MEGVSIIIPVFNRIETTLRCIDAISERNEGPGCEIIIVDNGSTDGTRDLLSDKTLTCIRNKENLGVSRACNIGAGAAVYDTLCFMHNDVFVHIRGWTMELRRFIHGHTDARVVGLYGAKMMRKDGTFRGKSVVHAMRDNPAIQGRAERVAVVDGLLMAMSKKVFEEIRGFNEQFPIHFYDKDISLRAFKVGLMNYILNIPFEHSCGTTRNDIPEENAEREKAQQEFMKIWKGCLPADVTTWKEKFSYLFNKALFNKA